MQGFESLFESCEFSTPAFCVDGLANSPPGVLGQSGNSIRGW
jgi:hypothetical protein